MTTRAEFVGRIRAGLGRPAGVNAEKNEPPEVDRDLLRLTQPDEDLLSCFSTRAAAAGMIVHRCTFDDLVKTLQSVLALVDARHIVVDTLDRLVAGPVARALNERSATIISPTAKKSLDPQFDSDAGITGVTAAIAETGTLVVASDATRSRGTFIIPPVHIALVLESQVIPDMIDLWPLIGQEPPTAVTLISGPSKTADIEGILVTGVHGPGAVHIILIGSDHEGTPSRTPGPRIQGDTA